MIDTNGARSVELPTSVAGYDRKRNDKRMTDDVAQQGGGMLGGNCGYWRESLERIEESLRGKSVRGHRLHLPQSDGEQKLSVDPCKSLALKAVDPPTRRSNMPHTINYNGKKIYSVIMKIINTIRSRSGGYSNGSHSNRNG